MSNQFNQMKYQIDLGVVLEENEFALDVMDQWNTISNTIDDMVERYNLRHVSAGTGDGFRDMQFETDSKTDLDLFEKWFLAYYMAPTLLVDSSYTYLKTTPEETYVKEVPTHGLIQNQNYHPDNYFSIEDTTTPEYLAYLKELEADDDDN